MGRKLSILVSLIAFTIFLASISQTIIANATLDGRKPRTIKIAVYRCASSFNLKQFQIAFNYQWNINNRTYKFDMTIIDKEDVLGYGKNPLTNENFDVFVIPASAKSYLIDGLNSKWKSNVQKFVSNGGGYLGICGGANAGSQGFEKPKNFFHRLVNKGVIGLANVFIDDDLLGEWQYLLKIGFRNVLKEGDNSSYWGYPSVNVSIEYSNENVIFSQYNEKFRYIAYAGGPAMYNASKKDPRLGKIIPLLTYNEELMETKPIHYWIPTLNGWKICRNVTTDLYRRFAGIATTYNSSGRVVLYGPHPEYPFVIGNGTIKEYFGRGYISVYFPFRQYVYNYVGPLLNFSYNIWIVRRSAAWAAHVPDEDLPPISEISGWLSVNGKNIFNTRQVYTGNVLISVGRASEDIIKAEFYIDDSLVFVDYEKPYQYLWDKKDIGKHSIKVVVYDSLNNLAYDTTEIWKIM